VPQCYFRPMAGWAARHVTEIPKVADGEAEDPDWYPLQHFFGVATFGANVFVATQGTETLVAEHDERSSGQQELYVVLEGEADFELAGEQIHVTTGMVIAVTDPAVKRRAVACAPGTMLLAIGAGRGPLIELAGVALRECLPRRRNVDTESADGPLNSCERSRG
jgi:hypothetical protein